MNSIDDEYELLVRAETAAGATARGPSTLSPSRLATSGLLCRPAR